MDVKVSPFAKLCFALFAATAISASTIYALTIDDIWLNEIHYDNTGADANEGIELAGVAGIEMSNLSVEFYTGSNGTKYLTESLSPFTLTDSYNGFGFLHLLIPGIQNGSPDGIALIWNSQILQFLSYEGFFQATNGTALGTTSYDIGVSQSTSTSMGYSLQFQGRGVQGIWSEPAQNTFGAINDSQEFPNIRSESKSVPESGASFPLLGLGILALLTLRFRR